MAPSTSVYLHDVSPPHACELTRTDVIISPRKVVLGTVAERKAGFLHEQETVELSWCLTPLLNSHSVQNAADVLQALRRSSARTQCDFQRAVKGVVEVGTRYG